MKSNPIFHWAALLLGAAATFADAAATDTSWRSRTLLTGDWHGARTALADRGVAVGLDAVVTYQNLPGGGFEHDDGTLGSTALSMTLDSTKAGLWRGGLLRLRGEGRYGSDVQQAFGGLSPLNVDAILPSDPDRVGEDVSALTELVLEQALSPRLGLVVGLLNTELEDASVLAGSLRANDRFLNAALLASPVTFRVTPNAALGAGVRFRPHAALTGHVLVYDSTESVGRSPFELRDGTTVDTEWALEHRLFGLPGRQLVGFRYGFGRRYSAAGTERSASLVRLAAGAILPRRDDAWAVYYNADQFLQQWGDGRGWGAFLRAGWSENEVNAVDWNAAFGFVAQGLLATRPRDTAGLGYYHFYQVDGPLLQRFAYDDEQGMEAWYNVELAPWLHVTADVQVIDTDIDLPHQPQATPVLMPGGLGIADRLPAALVGRPASDASVLFGLRTRVQF